MTDQQDFSTSNLTVTRGDRKVFTDLSFDAPAGKLLKLIGPNGSGKSTLLKTLAGLIEPMNGDIKSGGQSVIMDRDWTSKNVCYLGHKNALKNEFTVIENIEFWADLWGTIYKVDAVIAAMGIDYLRDTPVRFLSSGQTRRTALARTMCHGGQVWLYDEPTVGLDDQGLALLATAMSKHLDNSGIIICATHVDLGLEGVIVDTLNLADFTASNIGQYL
ncbi:MAG: heme ABC exporter ATP-binding protein CcmA [Emcibacteraceae bacterium]|nr:heme ABC exporter ATP-binding protein CcmA [Emcibacteraceae bacterium]MDG1994993.1 heme ABC exporter ATP-binding protein CcmA [Emcibacteraceae bacterium]